EVPMVGQPVLLRIVALDGGEGERNEGKDDVPAGHEPGDGWLVVGLHGTEAQAIDVADATAARVRLGAHLESEPVLAPSRRPERRGTDLAVHADDGIALDDR